MGTPDFAEGCLKALCEKHEVAAVFTQPDKPKGRKRILTPPPVKVEAERRGIPVYQPESLKTGEALDIIKEINADAIVVAAYGKILPKSILDAAKYGCINIHASLLPMYRGAAPIQWCIINGEEKSGVTIMMMDEGLDTGDVLLKKECVIEENDTASILHDKLMELGSKLIIEALDGIEGGTIIPEKQMGESCYSPMITRETAKIDFNKSAKEVHNLIRAMLDAPGAYAMKGEKTLKIYGSLMSDKTGDVAGKVSTENGRIFVCCGDKNCVELLAIKEEGSKCLSAKEFLMGRKIADGDILS